MRLDYRLALALMVAAGIGGSFASHALSLFAIPDAASGFHEYYLRGLAQPIPVVQFAANWSVLAVVWVTFFAISWLGGRLSADAAKRSSRPELVVIICFAIVGIALTTFSIMQAYDVYYYTAYGRLYGLHGANPYSYSSPYTFDDPTLTQNLIPTHNPPFPDPYGPGFTLFAGLVARLAGSAPLAAQLWSWRLIGLLSALTIAF